ncbi:MFS transporter [Zafaria sp. Z1313]|uniref:MFS transporter n=1 Tax=Zafaria sp. Z1313 TaxID=3423202 RepID=UPI003D302CDF
MLRALAHPAYRRLFGAQVLALAGTGLATVALALLAYDLAGPRAGGVLGTALAIKMAAYVLVAPLAAAAFARFPPRRVMVGADLLRLAVAASLPFVDGIWQVYVLVFVLQAASATFTPTFQAVIPEVLTDEEDYTAALSLSRLAYDLEAVLSPMLAAALLLVIPAPTLFFGTAAGFGASALLVISASLPRPRAANEGAGATADNPADAQATPEATAGPDSSRRTGPAMPFGARAREGTALFLGTPALRPILVLNLAVAAAGALVIVQTVVIARSVLGLDAAAVAWLLAANGAGSMAAALALPAALKRIGERQAMLGGAALLAGTTAAAALLLGSATASASTSASAIMSTTAPAAPQAGAHTWTLAGIAALWFAIGIGWSAVETPVGRLIRRHVEPARRPAAFAAQFSLSHACWLLTYPLAGWLGSWGLGPTAWLLAGLAGASAACAAWLWPRRRPPAPLGQEERDAGTAPQPRPEPRAGAGTAE